MKIWVDLASAPQVLFMQPLITEMRRLHHEVLITTREFTETISLADHCGLEHICVGSHGGKGTFGKAIANLNRAVQLTRLIRSYKVSIAVSHGSISQAITCAWLRMPMVALGDYEGQPGNHITCRVARRLIVPDVFCKSHLHKYGGNEAKIMTYPGIKEQVYLSTFNPDPHFMEKLGLSADQIVVTMRPPSIVSAYHRFRNTVFDDTIKYVTAHPHVVVVLLPRGADQRTAYGSLDLPNVVIPAGIVDGPQLVYCSDLVIGAGGTMNREATVLGTPAYTQFQGQSGSVDEYLIKQGKMVRVVDSSDIPSIKVCKKTNIVGVPWKQGENLVNQVVDLILS